MKKRQEVMIMWTFYKGKVYKPNKQNVVQKEDCIEKDLDCKTCKDKEQCEVFDVIRMFYSL